MIKARFGNPLRALYCLLQNSCQRTRLSGKMLRKGTFRAQFAGVDDHIDPRSAETDLWRPL